MIEHTLSLIDELLSKDCKNKATAAEIYATALHQSQIMFIDIDFKALNDAILKRWSLSGLEDIKNKAWKVIEHRGWTVTTKEAK